LVIFTRWSQALIFVALVHCGPQSAPPTVEIPPPAAPLSAAPIASKAPPPLLEPMMPVEVNDALDPRKSPRAKALLTTELQGLLQLLAATPATAVDRPMLLMRIAEDFAELRRAGEASASQSAIQHYAELTKGYPSFAHIDDARYFLGVEYLAIHDAMNARRTFYELISRSPSSRWVPYAYFAFGELFFEEVKSDPSKADLAKQAYREVIKFSTSPITARAAERLHQLP
jgi:tetratricopeptide (TPR) repeat protein